MRVPRIMTLLFGGGAANLRADGRKKKVVWVLVQALGLDWTGLVWSECFNSRCAGCSLYQLYHVVGAEKVTNEGRPEGSRISSSERERRERGSSLSGRRIEDLH